MTGGQGLLLGAHMSIAGGVHLAIGRGTALGCTAIQIFTKNATQWRTEPLAAQEIAEFKEERRKAGVMVVAHDAYLINLGSPDKALFERSVTAFRHEMDRAEELDIPYLVMHPGAHTGSGEHAGLTSISRGLNRLLKEAPGYRVVIVLENTAGQGTALGHSFEHLGRILQESVAPERMGVCLDTCHAFAAGYDLRDRPAYANSLEEFDRVIGLDRLKVLHLNDSKKGLESRVDRHEHPGRGMLGLECFRLIMNDRRFSNVPKLIETPKELDGVDMDEVNLNLLRGLVTEGSRDGEVP